MANETALRELTRVLKPGGGLALIWNREDDSIPWQAELLRLFEPLSIRVPQYWQGTWREAFANDFARQTLGVQDVDKHRQFFRWAPALLAPCPVPMHPVLYSWPLRTSAPMRSKIEQHNDVVLDAFCAASSLR